MVAVARSIKRKIDIFLLIMSTICFIMLVISVSYQVFTRYVLGNPSTITDELARLGQIYLALLAATYAWGARKHIAITFLLSKLSGAYKKRYEYFLDILISLFIVIGLIIGGWNLLMSNQYQRSPALGIPMNIVYLIFPLCGIFMLSYTLLSFVINHYETKEKQDESLQ